VIAFSSLRRLSQIIAIVIRHLLAQVVSVQLARWPTLARRFSLAYLSGPERLRGVLEELGGTFVKFGQMLALQPDILSLEYCNALFDLLDRCPPSDYTYIEQTLIAETGKTPAEIFETFDRRPLATASIGQVHVAVLRGHKKVAVKVQRSSVDTDFAGDIRLVTAAIRLIKRLHLRFVYWLLEPLTELVAWTKEELDYRCEARYMEQLRHNARNNLNERVPEVIWEFTTRRILVTEFLEGDTVLSYMRAREANDELALHRLKASGFDANQLARHIIDNFLGDAFQHGIFHADLHPANLLILPHNVVGYCDMGITGVISTFARNHLVALTLAYTRGDLEGMCEGFFKVSSIDRNSDVRGFREGLKRLAATWYEVNAKGRRLRKTFTMVMLDMLKLSRDTGVCPERDVIKYIRSSVTVDGLIMRFAPGFDVGQHLEATCDSYLKWTFRKSLVTYNALIGWASASEHIMRDGPLRVSTFLNRLAQEELTSRALPEVSRQDDRVLRPSPVLLGALVLAVSLIMGLTAEPVHLGVNLFTAELLFIGSATAMLLRTALTFSAEATIRQGGK
jgi:ubiquinone biosynthesis protein